MRELNSEHVSLSSQFKQHFCRRLRLSCSGSDRCLYFQCLHLIKYWQELPGDISQVYHIEAGAVQLVSVRQPTNKGALVQELVIGIPENGTADLVESILGWIESYLRHGFFLSAGIKEAFKSSGTATGSIRSSLTAAAINGQVISESTLCDQLQGFTTSCLDKRDLELARACLKNQSLPDQTLTHIMEYLSKTEEFLRSGSTVEACLILVCSAFLLNRKLPQTKSHNGNLISSLYEKFMNKEVCAQDSL